MSYLYNLLIYRLNTTWKLILQINLFLVLQDVKIMIIYLFIIITYNNIEERFER